MARPKPDKHQWLMALASYVLANGLASATLRPMAAAVGTSDRLLIYHFGNKENLMSELLLHLAKDLSETLDSKLAPVPMQSEASLVATVVDLVRTDPIRPYMRVWLEIAAGAANETAVYVEAGKQITETFLQWVAIRHPKGADGAPHALAMIEGFIVLDAVSSRHLTDRVIDQLLSNAD